MAVGSFLHISDLHIDSPNDSGQARVAAWAALPWFDTLLGHSYDSLGNIEALFRRLNRKGTTGLIVTGDITNTGNSSQFAYATNFMASELIPPLGNFVGLSRPGWNELAVPGNHNQWSGTSVFGGPPAELWNVYRTCPFAHEPTPLSTGHLLRFAGINTDSEVWPWGERRIMARGAFLDNLNVLDRMVPAPEANEIRVLLMHHSATHSGFARAMTGASRNALLEFAAKKGFYLMLCGHTHVPRIEPLDLPHGAPRALHACCGASSKMTTIPLDVTFMGQRPLRERIPNSVLLHRLIEEQGGLRWSVEVWFETSHGFRTAYSPSGAFLGSLFYPEGSGLPDGL